MNRYIIFDKLTAKIRWIALGEKKFFFQDCNHHSFQELTLKTVIEYLIVLRHHGANQWPFNNDYWYRMAKVSFCSSVILLLQMILAGFIKLYLKMLIWLN